MDKFTLLENCLVILNYYSKFGLIPRGPRKIIREPQVENHCSRIIVCINLQQIIVDIMRICGEKFPRIPWYKL